MIEANKNICKSCLTRWSNFENLTDEELEDIGKNRYEADFKAGEIIFKQGSPTSNAIFIVSGLAKVYIEGYDGKNIILAIAKPGMLISGPGTFVDSRHHYSFAALTKTLACFVDMNTMRKAILTNSKFAMGFLEDVSFKALGNFEKLVNFSQKKMHGRLAEGIIHLADEIYNSDQFECILNRKELGEFTGMTKESVVRLLKEFNDENIIEVKQNSIKILNKERLQKIMISG